MAQLLLEKEVIFKEDLERILGVRPYIDRQTQIDDAETSAQLVKDALIAEAEVDATLVSEETPVIEDSQKKEENSDSETQSQETQES